MERGIFTKKNSNLSSKAAEKIKIKLCPFIYKNNMKYIFFRYRVYYFTQSYIKLKNAGFLTSCFWSNFSWREIANCANYTLFSWLNIIYIFCWMRFPKIFILHFDSDNIYSVVDSPLASSWNLKLQIKNITASYHRYWISLQPFFEKYKVVGGGLFIWL